MDTDRNLLFGVLALQLDLIEPPQFAEACSAWAARKGAPLADLLVERGWLSPADRADVEKLLARKLKRHGGDAKAGLVEAADERACQSLAGAADPEIRRSLAGPTPPPQGHVLLSTTAYVPESRDRYTLSRLHATGGIGRVWLARDAALGRDVALKELRPERAAHPAVWARFLREAQITGQLEHPGIVPIYEVSRRPDDQAPFYTMRFVRGLTLSEAVSAHRARRPRGEAGLPALRELLTAFVGVCNAVAYAHSRGVIHRDLKPQNVVLGGYGEVIVLDWGLAKVVDRPDAEAGVAPLEVAAEGDGQATVQGQVLGTPAYMAPEQAEGRLDQIGTATDVYGLGAVLYEILTGRPPFTGSETAAVLRQVVHEAPARPRAVDAAAPPALEAVCLKALAKKPAGRYATAKDLAADVQRWLAGEPVSAYREPWPARAGRWVRRHRILVTGTAAAGLAALVGLAVILVLQARANQDLRAANDREQARFDLAMDAIKAFHAGVGEDDLLKQREFEGLRGKVLRQAADFYQKLEAQLRGQGDRRSRTALGQAYYDLGELTAQIGSKEEALAVHRRGLEVRQALTDEAGAGPDGKADVADSLLAVARLLAQTGKLEEALTTDGRARDLLRPLADARPDSARFHCGLGNSEFQIGKALMDLGREPEALTAFERARDVRKPLAESHADAVDYQNDLADSYMYIGAMQSSFDRLEEAMASYEQARGIQEALAAAHPDVPKLQVGLAVTNRDEGGMLDEAGKQVEAAAHYERSRAIREALAKAHPAVTEYQSRLAVSSVDVSGQLDLAGKPQEAIAALEQGRDICRALRKADPSVPDYQDLEIGIEFNIAQLLVETGKPQEALDLLVEVRDAYRTLGDAHPTLADSPANAASTNNEIGGLLLDLGRPEEARIPLEAGQDQSQALVTAHPGVAYYKSSYLANVQIHIGRMLLQAGKSDEALASFEKARDLCQPLADAHPNVIDYNDQLATALLGVGDVHQAANRTADASAQYERATAICEDLVRAHPGSPWPRAELALCLRRLGGGRQADGKAAEAAAAYRRAFDLLRDSPPHYPAQICEQACCQALLASVGGAAGSGVTADEGRAAADRAMELLKQAVALGYRNLDAMRIDPGLGPLRQRDDFRALMEEIRKQNKPDAPK